MKERIFNQFFYLKLFFVFLVTYFGIHILWATHLTSEDGLGLPSFGLAGKETVEKHNQCFINKLLYFITVESQI